MDPKSETVKKMLELEITEEDKKLLRMFKAIADPVQRTAIRNLMCTMAGGDDE